MRASPPGSAADAANNCRSAFAVLLSPVPLNPEASDLNHLLLQLRLWPLDLKTTQLYGDAFIELRRRGRVLSQVDIMVAALARQLKLTILTTDTDFDALPDLRTEDWSKAPS